MEGKNPYSDEVTQAAQLGIMGRLANPDEDQLAFAYPFFMLFILFPFSGFDIAVSQALWMSLNLLVFLTCLMGVYEKEKLYPLLGLTFYPFCFGIILGNVVNLICVIFLFVFNILILNYNEIKSSTQLYLGFLLSWTIIKPQVSLLLLLYALLICVRHRYFYSLLAFFLSASILSFLSFLFSPDWIIAWISQLQKYAAYNQSLPAFLLASLMSFTSTSPSIWAISLLVIVIMLLFSWYRLTTPLEQVNKKEANYKDLLFLVILAIASVFLMPRTLSHDQLLLMIGLFIGSRPFVRYSPVLLKFSWVFLSVLSWITFAIPISERVSSTNVIFPLVFSVTWLILFIYLYKRHKPEVIGNAPA